MLNPILTWRGLFSAGLVIVCFLPWIRGTVYYWDPALRTFEDSRDYCRSLGMELVNIHTEQEYTAVIHLLDSYSVNDFVWIGLSLPPDKDTEDYYVWLDGSPLSWRDWDDGDPNYMDSKKCVVIRMDKDKQYDSKSCSYEKGCVCEDYKIDDEAYPRIKSSLFTKLQSLAVDSRGSYSVLPGRSSQECAVRCTSSTRCHDFTFADGLCSFFDAGMQLNELCAVANCETFHRYVH